MLPVPETMWRQDTEGGQARQVGPGLGWWQWVEPVPMAPADQVCPSPFVSPQASGHFLFHSQFAVSILSCISEFNKESKGLK